MTITAKFAGTCSRCQQPIAQGEKVDWERGAGITHPAGTCNPVARPEPEEGSDLAKVTAYLYERSRKGELNDFTQSLLTQYERRGSLSDNQVGAVLRKIPGSSPVPLLPGGRYAVQVNPLGESGPGIDSAWLLINVWHPRGNPEVQRLYHVQSYDDKGQALRGQQELAAAKAIALDPAKAAIEFGHRTGHCYRCGHELDVNLSRSMGVGPVCVKHVMDDESRLAMTHTHRDAIRAAGLDPAEKNDDLSAVVLPS